VLYIRIVDPFRASYGVDQPLFAVMQLAQTSMRSELGKMTLDNTFEERDSLNEKIVRVCKPLQCCCTHFTLPLGPSLLSFNEALQMVANSADSQVYDLISLLWVRVHQRKRAWDKWCIESHTQGH
jgi:hypothetical protein